MTVAVCPQASRLRAYGLDTPVTVGYRADVSLGSARLRFELPGHQARLPISAVRLGEKNIAITNAASTMPADTANPTWERIVFPARVSDANVPARISPAAPMVGPDCLMACAAA